MEAAGNLVPKFVDATTWSAAIGGPSMTPAATSVDRMLEEFAHTPGRVSAQARRRVNEPPHGDDLHLETVLPSLQAMSERITSGSTLPEACEALAEIVARVVAGADYVSVARRRGKGVRTAAYTHDMAATTDRLQHEVSGSPSAEALESAGICVTGSLLDDPRWPALGALATLYTDVHSVLSLGLPCAQDGIQAVLNIYGRRTNAFDERARAVATLLTLQAAPLLSRVAAAEKVANLEVALASSREIGIAIGVLMFSRKITRDEAFSLLCATSQEKHRKLRDIAGEVAETGQLDAGWRFG